MAFGRLRVHLFSLLRVSETASVGFARTITLLWKNRKLSPEQQLEIAANVEDSRDSETQRTVDDCTDSFTGMEEAKMSHVCSFDIPLTVSLLLFSNFNCSEINCGH